MTEEKVSSRSDKFQLSLLWICWMVYTVAQIARYSYSSNVTLVMEKYGVSHADAGLPSTFYFFAYAIGQVVTGVFCKKYNKRLVVTVALIVSALCNVALFCNVEFVYVKYIWAINGLAQSNLWPLLMFTIGVHITDKYKRKAIVLMSASTSVGTFLSYGIGIIFAGSVQAFRYTFFVSAVLVIAAAAVWFFGSATWDSRTSAKVEEEQPSEQAASEKKTFSCSTIVLLSVFAEFSMMSLAISGGLRQWVPSIMKEIYGLSDRLSIFLTLLLPMVSILSALIADFLYAKFKNFLSIVGAMFVLSVVLFIALIATVEVSWIVVMLLFLLLTVAMNVVSNQMTAQVPIFMQDKVNSGFLAGFLNGCCYLGNAISTYGLGVIADHDGWTGVFVLLMCLALLSGIIAIVSYFVQKRTKKA